MKTTKEAVIKATSDLADEKGLNNVSLKAVAQKLNIRTPSLYNHIESLDNLLLEVAHNGMRDMNERMMKIAVGKIGKEAIKLVSIEKCAIWQDFQQVKLRNPAICSPSADIWTN